MLVELHIKDFAIIDELSLSFGSGLTVITGETGAGKSILVDAVNLILGATSDRDFVRSGTQRAAVDAVFRLPPNIQEQIKPILDEAEVEYETLDELTLTREVRATGRSTARINGSTCKLSLYREIGSLLVDIHGQSEHLSLLRPRQHIYLLDSFADLDDTRRSLSEKVRELQSVRREINSLQQDEAAIARRMDILEYQLQEINAAQLRIGEDDELREESNRLANSEKLLIHTQRVEHLLYAGEAGETAATELLAEAAIVLEKLAALDLSLQETAELAENLSIQAQEIADDMRRYSESVELSPGRLDEVEERLQVINNLKRKYGGSIKDVLEFARKAREELDGITNSEERMAELRAKEEKLLHHIGDRAHQLSLARQKAAQELAQGIEAELKQLRMEAARFSVEITQKEDEEGCYVNEQRLAFDITGIDNVEFMLSTNFGEPLKPLAKVASGGETARSMLALKTVLTNADATPSLIFDEIDQGIGGRLGAVVGEKLWRLTENHQVFCVTHLAQLASFADAHFRVDKLVIGDRTVTRVIRLDTEGRRAELMQMLGTETSSARENANDLLAIAFQTKNGQWVELG
jgi:DNA repair protein RecN (Recombination protein N)